MSIFDRFRSTPETPTPQTKANLQVGELGDIASERRSRKRINARKGATALIIDDSPTVVTALRKILRSAGFVTRDAFDAEQGLELIAQEKPDLVFLDIVLPGVNGFNALRAIRKDAATQHIPVIMISGNEHATEQFYANRIGADDFMKKPFSRHEVFAHVENMLDATGTPQRKGAATAATQSAVDFGKTQPIQAQKPSPKMVAATAPAMPPVPIAANTAPTAPAATDTLLFSTRQAAITARKELAAMGLQYFSRAQFFAAIERADQLAVELFVSSGGTGGTTSFEGKTALAFAMELGEPQIIALLQPASSGN
jgi:twitching motility two-component system response regulator PilH